MQSKNYVPGASGWKMHKDGSLEVAGSIRVATGQPAEDKAVPRPFIVVDGVTYMNEAFIKDASIGGKSKIESTRGVKTELLNGNYFCVGIGVGSGSNGFGKPDIIVSAESIEILPDGTVKIKQRQD